MPHTTTISAKPGSSFACAGRTSTRCLTVLGMAWRRVATSLFVAYRPERHYMRGPGPKWHERNSRLPR